MQAHCRRTRAAREPSPPGGADGRRGRPCGGWGGGAVLRPARAFRPEPAGHTLRLPCRGVLSGPARSQSQAPRRRAIRPCLRAVRGRCRNPRDERLTRYVPRRPRQARTRPLHVDRELHDVDARGRSRSRTGAAANHRASRMSSSTRAGYTGRISLVVRLRRPSRRWYTPHRIASLAGRVAGGIVRRRDSAWRASR